VRHSAAPTSRNSCSHLREDPIFVAGGNQMIMMLISIFVIPFQMIFSLRLMNFKDL
jgi:hypothetical protein